MHKEKDEKRKRIEDFQKRHKVYLINELMLHKIKGGTGEDTEEDQEDTGGQEDQLPPNKKEKPWP